MVSKTQTPDAPEVGELRGPFAGCTAAKCVGASLGHLREQQRLDVAGAEHAGAIERSYLSVHANRRPGARHQIDRRRATGGSGPHETLESRQRGLDQRRRCIGSHRRARQRQHDGRSWCFVLARGFGLPGANVHQGTGALSGRRWRRGRRAAFWTTPQFSASDLDPDIVAASRRNDTEALAREEGILGQHALCRADFVQDAPRLVRKQLLEDTSNRLGRQRIARQTGLPSLGDDVGPVAHVHDERVPIHEDDRLQK